MSQKNYRLHAAVRLFKAVLLLSKKSYTCKELAIASECSVKTVRRMISALEAAEIPLYVEDDGVLFDSGSRWRVDPFWSERWLKVKRKGGVSSGRQ